MKGNVVLLAGAIVIGSFISAYVARAQTTKDAPGGLMDRVTALERDVHDIKHYAMQAKGFTIFSGGERPGPEEKWVQAEVWNPLDPTRLGLPDNATIVGPWLTFEGEWGSLKNSNRVGIYVFPIVQVAIRQDLLSLRPLDIKEKLGIRPGNCPFLLGDDLCDSRLLT